MGRAPCCDKANVKKGPWSPEEDATLKSYIDQNGTGGNWIALPQKIGLKRCGKSCRLRWLNYLRPNIKHGGFSEEEDNTICSLYISIGSRWSIIAAQLPGRTDNDIKNYWNTRLKKKLLGRRKDSQARRSSILNQDSLQDPNSEEDNNSFVSTLSNSALERLQLHMQLQNLHSPFSFYNNPALWPKSHPLGEKMVQNHQNSIENQPSKQQLLPTIETTPTEKAVLFEDLPASSGGNSMNSSQNHGELVDSLTILSPFEQMEMSIMTKPSAAEQINTNFQSVFGLEAELNELINYHKTGTFVENGDQAPKGYNCFEEMDGNGRGKESTIWWANNDFDTKSSSSNSWDSGSVLEPDQGLMFQDYVLGYDDL